MSCHGHDNFNFSEDQGDYVVGLVAQPNAGKTTLFNTLTGARGYVANWPGKTVEVFSGSIEHHGKKLNVIDLPGIQSLHTLSKEEALTKEFILEKKFDAIILLINAESLYRSLYFVLQVLELTNKVVVAINKFDVAEKRGIHINIAKLEAKLGVPVVTISALKKIGIGPLMDRVMDTVEKKDNDDYALKINYGSLEEYIEHIQKIIKNRGLAVRVLEGDDYLLETLSREEKEEIAKIRSEIREKYGFQPEELIAMSRYKVVEDLIQDVIVKVNVAEKSFEEKIDKVILNNWAIGTIISLSIILAALFIAFTINTGFPLNLIFKGLGLLELADLIENYSLGGIISTVFSIVSNMIQIFMENINVPAWFIDLTVNGVIAGVSAVLSFLPLIFMVNITMSLIEDSGFMARMAVIFNKVTRLAGLTGKSFFPLGISLACNVPGILTTRILEDDKERYRVILTLPFTICQARLIVMIFLLSAFFVSPLIQTGTVLLLYGLSITMFLLSSKIISNVGPFKGQEQELILELPPYHIPSLRVISWTSWERSKHFITKAGKIIFPASIVIWIIMHIGLNGYAATPKESFGYMIGNMITKVFNPIGINSWEIGLALLSGIIAKEIVIETLAIAFSTENPLEAVRALNLTIPQALSILTFIMLYTPCIATLSAIYSETKSLKFILINLITQLSIPLISAYFIYALLTFL
ncbi:MAG: ferrous iron transport protein B [Thermoprotei archaeon]|jgi:ferrous iron transport protein B